MDMLSKVRLDRIGEWVETHARPVEKAKWNLMMGEGYRDDVVNGMLAYQNPDGGFGRGLEPDLIMPGSTAIVSAEAIFILLDYSLDGSAPWFQALLDYFLRTRQETPSFWEPIPKSIVDYPRPPWWNYAPDEKFSPNPCAVVAAGMLLFGKGEVACLGREVAHKCLSALKSGEVMQDHDIFCMQRLMIALRTIGSDLRDPEADSAMERRILGCVNRNPEDWMGYVAQPLDLVDSPNSPWYRLLEGSIPTNISFWLNNLGEDGVWDLNFSWGSESPEAKAAADQWKGYMAVKRVRILKAFGAVEV